MPTSSNKMTTSPFLATFAVFFMLAFHGCGVSAQAPAPAPEASTDCISELMTMADCLTYVEEGSNLTKPDKACCPELASLVNRNPVCLCYLLQKNSTSSYGIEIDLNRALDLPSVCKVETPPTSDCALGIPVEAPMASEGPSSANAPGGSELAPQGPSASPGNLTDSGPSTAAKSITAVFVGLAIASLPAFF
ncbi:non-specific lipid transfer protein GPI-anchored 2-like isoform X2 [Argentina anserina]|uniref:non-specific lipid transfer protein GPI-anchored 2-like isoform X2 n=1 Tax=Argentina anserina TaxID=57926 RepID=UPI00217686E2|nr:non-specific lipid transfer protein GPI-anchored 2-like isoform X2 [Potentilla anserina]